MQQRSNRFLTAGLLALLLAVPAAAFAAAQGGDTKKDDETAVTKAHSIVIAPDGEKHVRVITGPDGGEDVELGDGAHMVFITEDGKVQGEDGESHRFVWKGEGDGEGNFVWKDEDGNVVDLQEMPNVQFIAPHVARGFLGVELTDLTPELRRHFGAHEDRGVLVGRVVEDSPAERAGLRVGDVITHLDGEPVTSSFDVTARIGGRAAGDVAALEVVRDGKVETLSASLEVRERPQVEIGDLLRRFGEEGDGGFAYQFDTGELEKQLESVREHFSSPEWKQQMEQIEKDLQTQMQHIEVEIQGLQDKLDVDADVDVDTDADAEVESDGGS